MARIELDVPLSADHILTVQLPSSAAPGDEIYLRLVEAVPTPSQRLPLDLPRHHVGAWPENVPLRREDMYGDDGR